jgi:RimJ/RimL family protein N-acetyltransferase
MGDWLQEVELIGKHVKLLPLRTTHKEELIEAASVGELWKLWYTTVPSAETTDVYVEAALTEQKSNKSLPFIAIDLQSDKLIGSTRYCNIDSQNKRLEIGHTWYSASFQRTGVNTECKYLLLQHAFEKLDCIAVEFRTNWFNHKSRNAIRRIGAKQDGILRNHRIDNEGRLRDTVVFSILRQEWTAVKTLLAFEIDKYQK